MFRVSFYAGVASVCLTGIAAAADLPGRAAPAIFVPPVGPAFSWTGLYVGGNAGSVWNAGNIVRTIGNDPITNGQLPENVPSSQRLNASGITAGGQVGYNYQFSILNFGGVVVGAEADGTYTDLNAYARDVGKFGLISQYHSQLDELGTIRGRLGITLDRFLFYGTGGFAYGHITLSQGIFPAAVPPGFPYGAVWAGRGGHTQTGYAIGGGVEYAIPTRSVLNPFGAGAVTVRAEYLHYDLGTLNVAIPAATYGPTGTFFSDRIHTAGNLVRSGIDYKFDFAGPAPVAARY